MSELLSISTSGSSTAAGYVDYLIERRSTGVSPAPAREPDAVDLSERARRAATAASATGQRAALLARLRQSIARGDYLTPEKVEAAADRMYEELAGR